MQFAPLIRSFIPGQNAWGFSPADTIVFAIAVLVTIAFALTPRIVSAAHWLSSRPWLAAAILFAIPVATRLCLLGQHPVPIPRVADDFSYILLGDTLAHLRLANPPHPLHQFFEAVFVLQQPSYASIFPLGQGMVLALGQVFFREPWVGVLLMSGLLAAATFWMLSGWVPSEWALLGGCIVALEIGALSSWVNTYWGGSVTALAGCLIFSGIRRTGRRAAIYVGAGLALQLLTRPFEFVLLLPALLLFRPRRSMIAIAALIVIPVGGLTLWQNRQVTGNWLTLPYQLSRYQYGVPTTFTLQPNPVPHQSLTAEQKVDYAKQTETHGAESATALNYLGRIGERLRFLRFFFVPALYVGMFVALLSRLTTLGASVAAARNGTRTWVPIVVSIVVLWLGDGFYPYFYPHYIAVVTCLLILIAIESLRRLNPRIVTIVIALFIGHFIYALTPAGADWWNGLNQSDPENRASIQAILDRSAGEQLVFVHYSANHGETEWIHNKADIDRARVVWAIDLGHDQNSVLQRYYPSRTAWLLEADARPPLLRPYPTQ